MRGGDWTVPQIPDRLAETGCQRYGEQRSEHAVEHTADRQSDERYLRGARSRTHVAMRSSSFR